MDEHMTLADIDQIFGKCVIFYKNKPVFVEKILPDYTLDLLDLLSQKRFSIPFNLKSLSNPVRRVGFININKSVLYAHRAPVRRFKAGLCDVNIRIKTIGVDYPFGRDQTKSKARNLYVPEVGKALINEYPTFKESLAFIQLGYSAVAFDKQFAIDTSHIIWYKDKQAGVSEGGIIKFFDEMKHLKPLLGENYESA